MNKSPLGFLIKGLNTCYRFRCCQNNQQVRGNKFSELIAVKYNAVSISRVLELSSVKQVSWDEPDLAFSALPG